MFLLVAIILFSADIKTALSILDPPIQTKIQNIKLFKNISDKDLIVDLSTFINEHGEKPGLRLSPQWKDPNEIDVKNKALDMMKQAIYGTQMRLRDLDPVLEKHKHNPAFKMAFLFGRLKQLLIDLRRIYTLAIKKQDKKKVYEHIILYQFICRKHIDVIYLVEHVIDLHNIVMRGFSEHPEETFGG